MVLVYSFLTTILYPVLIGMIFLRTYINKEHKIRYKEKIFSSSFNIKRKNNTKLIWFHAASIGELKSILSIIEELNLKNKDLEFLITTVTLSSGNLAKELFKIFDNVQHRYFPIDVNFLMKKFIKLWKPDAIFLVDSEIWPNLILSAKKLGIPIALLNARITKKTYLKWKIFPRTTKKIFENFNLCLTSNMETKKYLKEFNSNNIFYKGNLKLTNKININNIENIYKEFLEKEIFWLAANTHNGEEIYCIKTHLKLQKRFKNITTVIAPRHTNRSKDIKDLCKKFGLKCQILNKNEKMINKIDVVIINFFGHLDSFFYYAKSVFIGKSMLKKFQKEGGQSPVEAAKLGCKVYHGAFVYNFEEIYEILKKNKISKEINDTDELARNISDDFSNFKKDDQSFINLMNILGQKTLNENMKEINKFLFNEN